jgi:multidrug resistance protein MdtO
MARLAGELRRELSEALALLRPFPGRLEFAVRLALICALTTLVVEIYQTPEPALTAYVAFFVMKRDRMESIVVSIVMTILISLIIGIVLLIAMKVIDEPLWRVTSMAALSFGMLFLASASKLKPIGGIVALIVAYALDLLARAQIGELATRAYLYVWLFVGIPAGVSILVNLLLGPLPRRLIERALAHRLVLAATLMRTPNDHVREDFTEAVSEGVTEIQTWLKLAGAEKTSPAEDIAALGQATASITPILVLVDFADRAPAESMPPSLRDKIAGTLDQMASILDAGGYPIEIAIEYDGNDLPPLAAALLSDMNEALRHFTEKPLPDSPPLPEKAEGGFFLPDAFTNPEHVYYALKTTAAAMFCYATYSLLDWPGIHTALITCYIVSLGTTAETVEKLTLRILGCLVGAATGIGAIVFLMPHVTSIGGLMIVVFVGALVSGWVAAGSPRISYVGFQIAFAFFLSVVQGAGPAFDMTIARDRVIGILFGNVVVYLLFTNVWPVTVTRRIDPAIAALLQRLSAMMGAISRARRCALATEAAAALGAIEQDLHLARYEPPSIRPAEAWLDVRRTALRELASLLGPLLLCSNQQPAPDQAIARRLDGLAADLTGGAELTAPLGENNLAAEEAGSTNRPPSALDGLVVTHLRGLEDALRAGDKGVAGHAPA